MSHWSFEHTVDARVSPETAWAFWTDVSHWTFDRSLEEVTLDGPFAAGTRGRSRPRGAEPTAWLIREAGDGRAVIEVPFPGVLWTFEWTFRPGPDGGTRITQRIELSGPAAREHVPTLESGFVPALPEGMRALAHAMETHEESRSDREE